MRGFADGGQGIWWACYNRSYVNGNCGPNDPPGTPPAKSGYYTWDQCLEFEVGGRQIPAMAAFFRRLPWYKLEPNGTAVEWDANAPKGTQQPYQKADSAGDYVVAYLPQANGNPHTPDGPGGCRPSGNITAGYGGTLSSINPSVAHTLSWYNPRTAVASPIVSIPKGTTKFSVPSTRPSDAQLDWVFLMEPDVSPPLPASTASRGANEFAGTTTARVPSGTSWVTNVSLHGHVRFDPSEIGCTFTATQSIVITHLCRLPTPNSRNIQTISLYTHNGSLLVSAPVDALNPESTDPLGFECTAVSSATLEKGAEYVATLQTAGCDGWYDDTGTTVSVVGGADAAVTSVYGHPPKLSPGGGGVGHCYGPLNFYFTS